MEGHTHPAGALVLTDLAAHDPHFERVLVILLDIGLPDMNGYEVKAHVLARQYGPSDCAHRICPE